MATKGFKCKQCGGTTIREHRVFVESSSAELVEIPPGPNRLANYALNTGKKDAKPTSVVESFECAKCDTTIKDSYGEICKTYEGLAALLGLPWIG